LGGTSVVTVTDAVTGPTWTPTPTVSARAADMDQATTRDATETDTAARFKSFPNTTLTPWLRVQAAFGSRMDEIGSPEQIPLSP
jgi:hypothetical protein